MGWSAIEEEEVSFNKRNTSPIAPPDLCRSFGSPVPSGYGAATSSLRHRLRALRLTLRRPGQKLSVVYCRSPTRLREFVYSD
jgi:hypothetical protein